MTSMSSASQWSEIAYHKSGYLPFLDGLRAIAVLSEVLPEGQAVRFLGTFACPSLIGVDQPTLAEGCSEYTGEALAFLERDSEIGTVVVLSRHATLLKGPTSASEAGGAEAGKTGIVLPVVGLSHAGSAGLFEKYMARLDATVAAVRASGRDVVFVLPVPEFTLSMLETARVLARQILSHHQKLPQAHPTNDI